MSRGVRPVAPGSGCETFAQAALLRVDRELGPAESAALDAHLAACPACRAKAQQAEALSAVLKRWDNQQTARIEVPARLRMALRAAVSNEGRWRREESRRIRRLHVATAAAVVLALAAGLLAGLLRAPEAPAAEPAFETAYVPDFSDDPLAGLPGVPPTVPPTVPPSVLTLTADVPGASRLGDLVIDTTRPATWLSPEERDEARRVLAGFATQRLVREAFERDYGEDAFWLDDARSGEGRLITRSALMHLQASPALAVLRSRAVEEARTVADPVRILDTGRTIADFLGLPERRDALEVLLGKGQRPIKMEANAPAIGYLSIFGAEPDRKASLPRTVDLAYAVGKGVVTLREGAGDDLVAMVTGSDHPIFIPAGELIAGGRVDRVVLEGIHIPVTTSARPILIPCVSASSPGGRHGEEPTPTGMMAGPTLRHLLARRVGANKIRAWIAKHVPITDRWGRDYSMLDSYDSTAQIANERILTGIFLAAGARGFSMADPKGGFVGVEVSDLPRESAAPLLARLVVGYTAEARMLAGEDAPARRVGARPSIVTLLDLVGSKTSFRVRETRSSGARVLRMVEPRTDVGVEIVENEPGGAAVLASGFAP